MVISFYDQPTGMNETIIEGSEVLACDGATVVVGKC
jgi:hypothetical protein